ncbi:hypothetical protein KFK09_024171 [Dendrobium nobile]|uniref:Uncharacterized protein n=1 Tax=Dendrobium nobile TaxID=94219 RepID=A0A8T3AD08_DENNO|nr:hypothetical protein KFK09_024171 [Dendrobium nobile]
MLSGIFFHAAISFTAAILAYFLNLPVLTLQGLHTYIHPDSIPAADGTKALLRRPGAIGSSFPDPKRRSRSKDSRLAFDESKAQLFRLRLADSLLPSRLFFATYRSSFLSSFISLFNISICILFPLSDPFAAIPFAAVIISASHLLISLLILSLERSASRFSERRLSLLSALISFLLSFIILIRLSPSVFDFRIPGAVSPAVACLAGFLVGILFTPAARAARSFWLGTDQLRWNLSVISCGTFGRVLLYTSVILSFVAPLLWVKPLALAERFEDWRVWALAAAAGSQLLVLRSNVQMYLNEPVMCWYQRLHSSRVPDLDYGRAKVFLHNHYVCLAVIQFFASPVLVLLLAGLSQLRGNLFGGFPFAGGLMKCSDIVKEMALFIAWWIMFGQSVLMLLFLSLHRCGFVFVS